MTKCNLELQLLPLSASFSSDSNQNHLPRMEGYLRSSPQGQDNDHNEHQQMTIFYNGRVCVCDVTELQARSILTMASREMNPPASPSIQYELCSSGLSMKRSLQRFLQKRKNRIHATSPYHH